MSCVSCEMVAVKSSTSLDNKFTSSVFLLRVCLFVVIAAAQLCQGWTSLVDLQHRWQMLVSRTSNSTTSNDVHRLPDRLKLLCTQLLP